ncbi:8993_t:CDS:2 [Funneliformis mosseae]|uniref:8993_t:CDS:1 n=1 Tax=Funneliformis mosseae TaxID=27381 RepID=A0A9N9GJ00_FUNMO|nr:8993_t:CDS:2 [Funneliformis mosseae]
MYIGEFALDLLIDFYYPALIPPLSVLAIRADIREKFIISVESASLKTNQDEDEIIPKLLRKTGAKHASMVYAGLNPTPQHLDNLSEIALRHKINHFNTGKNYALGDPKSKEPISDSDSKPETSNSLKPQTQASSPALQPDPKKSQTMEMDSMLAEIDAMLAEIRK